MQYTKLTMTTTITHTETRMTHLLVAGVVQEAAVDAAVTLPLVHDGDCLPPPPPLLLHWMLLMKATREEEAQMIQMMQREIIQLMGTVESLVVVVVAVD